MENENRYVAPNGVNFLISVEGGVGQWHCLECGQVGDTAIDYGDDAVNQAQSLAREHSVMCGAGRGRTPRD